MVLTRTLETASTGRFLTIYFFLHFWGSEPEPAEPELAESGVVTEPLEPNRLDQEPTRTEPSRPFPHISRSVPFSFVTPFRVNENSYRPDVFIRVINI